MQLASGIAGLTWSMWRHLPFRPLKIVYLHLHLRLRKTGLVKQNPKAVSNDFTSEKSTTLTLPTETSVIENGSSNSYRQWPVLVARGVTDSICRFSGGRGTPRGFSPGFIASARHNAQNCSTYLLNWSSRKVLYTVTVPTSHWCEGFESKNPPRQNFSYICTS